VLEQQVAKVNDMYTQLKDSNQKQKGEYDVQIKELNEQIRHNRDEYEEQIHTLQTKIDNFRESKGEEEFSKMDRIHSLEVELEEKKTKLWSSKRQNYKCLKLQT